MEKKHMIMGMLIVAGIIIIAGAASADYTGLNVTQSDKETMEFGWVQSLGIGVGILFVIVGIVVNWIYKPAPKEDEDEEDEDDEGAEEYECPTCGAGVPADASECKECGELFEAGDDMPDDEEEPDEDEGPEDEAEPDMDDEDDDGEDDEDDDEVYECPTCGGGVGDDDTVCPHCGEEFE